MGPLVVRLSGAKIWDPSPDWPSLRRSQVELLPALRRLCAAALRHAPDASLMWLLGAPATALRSRGALSDGVMAATASAAQALAQGWSGNEGQLRAGAARLAGLGVGLTPAGDDWLVGAMLWAWLASPDPPSTCSAISQAAAPRTTTLSAAYLRAAAAGRFSAPWHRLLAAVCSGSDAELEAAAQGLLAVGHTSGADALAGFLYVAQHSAKAE